MSEAITVNDVVSAAVNGDAKGTRDAIKDVIQQKVMGALENKRKAVASSFLNRENNAKVEEPSAETPQEPTQEVQAGEVENGS